MRYHPGLPTRALLGWLLIAGCLAAGALVAARDSGEKGLVLTVRSGAELGAAPPRRVSTVDGRDLWPAVIRRPGPLTARWEGFWRVPEAGTYQLEARSDDAVWVSLDGREVLARRPGARSRGVTARVELGPGFHALAVGYEAAAPGDLRVLWARSGERLRSLDPASLFTIMPSASQQARGRSAAVLGRLALMASLAPLLAVALLATVSRARSGRWLPEGWEPAWWRGRPGERLRFGLRVALPALVVVYAAAMRFEALVGRYAGQGPPWALEAERALRALHPASLRWEPALEGYSGDPYNYLVRAREMNGFYEPSIREPLFPAVTRQMLKLFGDRNLAVNAASALFSTLAVVAAYLLGAYGFSRLVGLGAALGLAIHRDVLWWAVEGFRDDAFMLFAVASALALVRLNERPTFARAVVAGLAGGGAVLSRVSSFSFLIPAFAWLTFGRRPDAAARRRAIAVSVGVMLAVAGPYLLSCALAYGDPLYAVNAHTRFYRSRSGMPADSSMGWLQYLHAGFAPFHLLDTGLTGLTTYPFANKWGGFDYLSPWVGRVLSAASVAGLLLFLGSPAGRVLLVVLVTSLLPYAFTWEVPGGAEWRFTMAALPFYLVAAWLALARAARVLDPATRRDLRARFRVEGRAWAAVAVAAAGLVVAAWAGLSALTYLRVRESLRAGEPAMIAAGARDWFFFGPGWRRPARRGSVTVRQAERGPAVVWLPLAAPVDHRLTMRADPDPPAPGRTLEVAVNGIGLTRVALEWDEKRIGSYELLLPARLLRAGRNRLELGPGGFAVWYLRIEPAPDAVSGAGSAR